MSIIGFDRALLSSLHRRIVILLGTLDAIRCADPQGADAIRVVSQARLTLRGWLPPIEAALSLHSFEQWTRQPLEPARTPPGQAQAPAAEVSSQFPEALTVEDVGELADALQVGDLSELIDSPRQVEWLAHRLELIAADPSLAAAFAARFDRWAGIVDLLAVRRATDGAASAADRSIVALASIHDAAARPPGTTAAAVTSEMDPYAAALFVRSLVLTPDELAALTDEILTRLGDGASWIDTGAGPGAADVLFANLLAHPAATTPFVILAAAHPHQLLLAATDPGLAQDVLLAGTDPSQIGVADAGTVVHAVIADLDAWYEPSGHGDDAYLSQRAFLGALIAPWLFQFGPRADEWAWTEDVAAGRLAWVLSDNAAMNSLLERTDVLRAQFAATAFLDPDGHLDLAPLHELGALWQLVGAALADEERADDARTRAWQDQVFIVIQKMAVSVIGVGGPGTWAVSTRVASQGRTAAETWLAEHDVIAPDEEESAADAAARLGGRTSTLAIISVVAVVSLMIDAGQLPADALDDLDLEDDDDDGGEGGGACTAANVLERLQQFAAGLPAGEARAGVDDVVHVFLNEASAASTCD